MASEDNASSAQVVGDPPRVFVPPRNRDAWATIRGFVYQVELTILRWLQLGSEDALDLERGEDIDLVVQALASSTEQTWLLEQVKLRDESLTLRHVAALEAIANAIEHLASNTAVQLSFLYTTNARVGREQSPPESGWPPGIEIWESIRTGTVAEIDRTRSLRYVRALLQAAPKPSKVSGATWKSFRHLVSADDMSELDRLIHAFAWNPRNPGGDLLETRVLDLLVAQGYAPTRRSARECYLHLFLGVFRALSRPGLKRLTRTTLQNVLATDSQDEHEALGAIRALLDGLHERVDVLEQRVDSVTEQLASMIVALAQTHGLEHNVILGLSASSIEEPDMVPLLCRRASTVTSVLQAAQGLSWLALLGTAGTGRTHLARLLIDADGGCVAWIRLRDQSPNVALASLQHTLTALGGPRGHSDLREWIGRVVRTTREGRWIVLDDLPDLGLLEGLADFVRTLAIACADAGRRLLTIGHAEVPLRIREHLAADILICLTSPALSLSETVEIFCVHMQEQTAQMRELPQLVHAATGGHSTLVSAAARMLSLQRSATREETIWKILEGQHARETMGGTAVRLLSTVTDDDARELLFRLRLIIGSFTMSEVHALAGVSPKIPRASDRLDMLSGIWIEHDVDGRYKVSPLVRALPDDRLSPSVSQECHRLLARILFRGTIDGHVVLRVLLHHERGGESDAAGIVLTQALNSLRQQPPGTPDWGLLGVWWDLPLPPTMSPAVCVVVRATQLAAGLHTGKRVDHIVTELERLVLQASSDDAWAVFYAGSDLFHQLFKPMPAEASIFLKFAIRALPALPPPLKDEVAKALPAGLAPIVWVTATEIYDLEHLQAWLDILEVLPTMDRVWRDADLSAFDLCEIVANKLWLEEINAPAGLCWDTIHERLDILVLRSDHMGFEYLWACAIQAKATVLCEYEHRFDEGIGLLESAVTRVVEDASRAVLLEGIGRQFLLRNQNDLATGYLLGALEVSTTAGTLLRVRAAMEASRAVGLTDAKAAVLLAGQAVVYAEEMEDVSRIGVLGELAIAQFISGDLLAATRTLDNAVRCTLAHGTSTDDWKTLILLLRHVCGYIVGSVQGRRLVQSGPDGYACPQRGMFATMSLSIAAQFDSSTVFGLCAIVAQLAGAMEEHSTAVGWAERCLEHQPDHLNSGSALHLIAITPWLVLSHTCELTTVAFGLARAVGEMRSCLPNVEMASVEAAFGVALMFGVVPISLKIVSSGSLDRDAARDLAFAIAKIYEELSLAPNAQDVWGNAARFLRSPFSGEPSSKELWSWIGSARDDDQLCLRMHAVICLSLAKDAELSHVAATHVWLIPRLWAFYSRDTRGLLLQVVIPWLISYWEDRFQQQRVAFRAPRYVYQEFVESSALPLEIRVRKVLQAVLESLPVRQTPEILEWMHTS